MFIESHLRKYQGFTMQFILEAFHKLQIKAHKGINVLSSKPEANL